MRLRDTDSRAHARPQSRPSADRHRVVRSLLSRQSFIAGCGVGIASLVWSISTQPPIVSITLTALVSLLGFVSFLRSTYVTLYLYALGVLLAGYAMFGRGFAYLGFGPVFVGELALLLGGVALAVVPGPFRRVFRSPTIWLLAIFVVLGALRTLPYVNVFGIDAFRDGVVWGYAVFAVIVASLLSRPDQARRVFMVYGRMIPWFLLWLPVAGLVMRFGADFVPQTAPGVPFIALKSGDIGVHLSGALAFLVLRPVLTGAVGVRLVARLEPVLWLAWFIAFAQAFNNRGAIVTVLVSGVALLLLHRSTQWRKPLLLGLAAAAVFAIGDVEIPLSSTRSISIDSVTTAVTSLVAETGESALDNTRRWRLDWWTDIVNYTVFGEHFWMGKGFGINLANDDGYQVHGDNSLRSPHNAHLTVLARLGVPGALIWLLLLSTFAWGLLRGIRISTRQGDLPLATLMRFILIYWLAFIVNANFDVFLEGPQGSIWFWCLVGFGIALTQLASERAKTRRRMDGPTWRDVQ